MPTHMVTMELAVLVNIQGETWRENGGTCVSFFALLGTKLTKGFIFLPVGQVKGR